MKRKKITKGILDVTKTSVTLGVGSLVVGSVEHAGAGVSEVSGVSRAFGVMSPIPTIMGAKVAMDSVGMLGKKKRKR